mgnify:CR=1 FL=1
MGELRLSSFCASASWQKGSEMTTAELVKIAKVVYAEGGIFSGKNYNALLAIAQCIHDLLPSYKDLDTCLESAFTAPSDQYDHSVYRQHKQYSSRDSADSQMQRSYNSEVSPSTRTETAIPTKKSWSTCTHPMTIWAAIPYHMSGDTSILEERRRRI